MSAKRNKSNIWQFFEKVEEKISKCRLCQQECRTAGNTSNLWDHFKRKHTMCYIDNSEGDMALQVVESVAKLKEDVEGHIKPPRKKPRKTIFPGNRDQLTDKNIIPLPGGRSEVWKRKFFGFYSNDGKTIVDKQRAVCCLCFSEIPYSGNTTNLGIHLAKKHPDTYQDMKSETEEQGKQASPSAKSPSAATRAGSLGNAMIINTMSMMPRGGVRAGNITESVATFLIKDLHSMAVADEDGFRQLLHVLEPRYETPDINNLNEVLQNRRDAITTVLTDKLSEIETCTLVIDCWQSDNGHNYCTLMIRFIDNDWQVQTYVLKTLEISSDENNHIWDIINVLNYWSLMAAYPCSQSIETPGVLEQSGEFSVYTLDVNQKKLIAVVINENENVAFGLKIINMTLIPCFVNVVNNAVNVGINSPATSKLIEKARRLVAHFSRTSKVVVGRKLLDDESDADDSTTQMGDLALDVNGRWTSTTEMITRLLEIKASLISWVVESKDESIKELNLTPEEWCQLEVLHGALKGFSIAIGVLGGEDSAPCSMVTPLLHRQREKFTKITENESAAVYQYNKCVWENLDHHYSEVQSFFHISTFLDPRFKDLVDLNEVDRQKAIQEVRQRLLEAEEAQQTLIGASRDDANEAISPSKSARQRNEELHLLFGTVEENDLHSGLMNGNDLDRYLSEALIGIKESPLEWWDNNSNRFPTLSKVAKRYLCVPATAIPSECVLSPEGSLFYNRRRRLHADEVDLMIFLNKNLSLIG